MRTILVVGGDHAGGVVFILAGQMSYFDILRAEPTTVQVSFAGIAGRRTRLRDL
ncbi:hypothetical protein [Dactylosporangium darangshiense]|uniref:Uncharacterized protein n=1 Tax=Dactylosporangium darangshiense TaxID=579108 RepID=A0ABP8DW40_9ACTN